MPVRTSVALRRLYQSYQRQKRGWGYIVLSAFMISSLFIVFSLFANTDLWVLVLPLIAVLFAIFQIRKCGDLVRVLRQAWALQREIDQKLAEAEKQAEVERQAEEKKQAEIDAQVAAVQKARAAEYAAGKSGQASKKKKPDPEEKDKKQDLNILEVDTNGSPGENGREE